MIIKIDQRSRRQTVWEEYFTTIVFLFYSGAFIRQFEKQAGIGLDPGKSDSFNMLISYPFYLITAFLISRKAFDLIALLKKEKFIACMIIIAPLSVLWSELPLLSLKRSVGFIFLTLFGVYLTLNYSDKDQLRILANALGIAVIMSLLFALFIPSYGIDQGAESIASAGAWQGIFSHKNLLGRVMALSLLVFAIQLINNSEKKFIHSLLLILSIILLLLSRSATSTMSIAILIALIPLIAGLRANRYLRLGIYCFYLSLCTLGILCLSANMANFVKSILSIMGRDMTLTGRTSLWEILINYIQVKPILGYGFQAFWAAKSDAIHQEIDWPVWHSHNGFIDLWLTLGLIGLLTFIIGAIIATRNAVKRISITNGFDAYWPLIYLIFLFFNALVESPIVESSSLMWLLYVSVAISPYRG